MELRGSIKDTRCGGAWLAQSVERATLVLRVVCLSPMFGVEIS